MPRYFDTSGPYRKASPDYFADNGKPKKADWKKHEKDIAKRSGDRQVRGSGNKPGRPGDAMGGEFIREGKATKKASISVQAKWLKGIVEQGLRMGRTPVVEIRLEGAQMPVPTDWVLIPALDFQAILEARG